jgi:hypothetical protein
MPFHQLRKSQLIATNGLPNERHVIFLGKSGIMSGNGHSWCLSAGAKFWCGSHLWRLQLYRRQLQAERIQSTPSILKWFSRNRHGEVPYSPYREQKIVPFGAQA